MYSDLEEHGLAVNVLSNIKPSWILTKQETDRELY